MEKNFFKSKKILSALAIASFTAGFFFIDENITGNAVITNKQNFNVFSLIGLGLIICSVVLEFYLVKNK